MTDEAGELARLRDALAQQRADTLDAMAAGAAELAEQQRTIDQLRSELDAARRRLDTYQRFTLLGLLARVRRRLGRRHAR